MNGKKHISIIALSFVGLTLVFSSCKDSNSPGYEYMPDMYRSPAIEAYVDYGQDPYYFGDSLAEAQREIQQVRKPVEGTIPFSMDESKAAYNFPYPYPNSNEGYEAAGAELKSPIAMTEETVEAGKAHYEIFCKHCHGDKGAGNGAVVEKGGYPAPGAYDGPLKELSEGKIFHSLMYGKNMAMGSHASQLSREERWEVVQYVKYLQNGGNMTRESEAKIAADTTGVE
jgi:mono/diheme cytochrome c family protein